MMSVGRLGGSSATITEVGTLFVSCDSMTGVAM